MMDRFSEPSCVAMRIHLIIPTKSLLNAFSITLYFITAVYIFSSKTKRSLGHLCAVIVVISIKYKVIRPSSFAPSSATRVHPTTTCYTSILSKSQGLKTTKQHKMCSRGQIKRVNDTTPGSQETAFIRGFAAGTGGRMVGGWEEGPALTGLLCSKGEEIPGKDNELSCSHGLLNDGV